MEFLITGSHGFIGRHLSRELLEHGHGVIGIDWSAGGEGSDLRQPEVFSSFLDEVGHVDMVIHLAAQVGRLFGDDDLIFTVQENAQITTLVARACGEAGVPLCYTSTSEIYGDQRHAVCDEYEGPFDLPHNLYGLTKRWGEEVAQLFAPRDLIIVRPSMPYGPGVAPGRGRAALPNMLWQAHTRQRIPVHRGSERSWCYIDDAVRGFRMILEKGGPGIYNLGRDDDPRPMLEIAELACDMTGAPWSLIDQVNPPDAQTVVKRLSTDRLRSLGWRPEVPLEEGMQRVLWWVKKFDEIGNQIDNR